MKTYLSVISDCFFALCLTFVLSFFALNYFIERPFSIAFAFILSAFSAMLFYSLSHKKYLSNKKKNLQEKEFKAVLSALNLLSPSENNSLLVKALTKKGYATERKKGGVFLPDHNAVIFLFFGFIEVSKARIVKAFNSKPQNHTAYLVAPQFSPEVIYFAERFDGKIKTITADQYCKFLKDANLEPKQKLSVCEQKKGLAVFKSLLEKRKAKRFLSFGIIFLFMTFFVPLKVYYTVSGCVFLLYAFLLHFFGKETT